MSRCFLEDYVFADNDGAQIIPKEVIDEVLLRVEEIHTKENEQRKALAGWNGHRQSIFRVRCAVKTIT